VIDAILFDLDNTLVDRDAAFARWLRVEGLVEGEPGLEARTPANVPRFVEETPGVKALLTELRARYPLALVTNGGSETQRKKLHAAGLEQSFDAIIVSAEHEVDKPDPAIFALALDALGQPARALFVGDDPEADVQGARAAGLFTCWISRGRAWPANLAAPDHVLDDVTQLREIVPC
jgi:putative hydrolase of the HAD superfamily